MQLAVVTGRSIVCSASSPSSLRPWPNAARPVHRHPSERPALTPRSSSQADRQRDQNRRSRGSATDSNRRRIERSIATDAADPRIRIDVAEDQGDEVLADPSTTRRRLDPTVADQDRVVAQRPTSGRGRRTSARGLGSERDSRRDGSLVPVTRRRRRRCKERGGSPTAPATRDPDRLRWWRRVWSRSPTARHESIVDHLHSASREGSA